MNYHPALLVLLALPSCGGAVQHCPPKTAAVAITCRQEVTEGKKTREQCYAEIEEACP